MQLPIVLVVGIITLFSEFRNIRNSSIFVPDMRWAPFVALIVLTLVYLVKNTKRYPDVKKLTCFIPSIAGLVLIIITIAHKIHREQIEKSPTIFSASTGKFGSDGGFKIKFKKNGYLTGRRIDRFSETEYWGTYSRIGDTIRMQIPLDFEMKKTGIIRGNKLIMDDSVYLAIYGGSRFE